MDKLKIVLYVDKDKVELVEKRDILGTVNYKFDDRTVAIYFEKEGVLKFHTNEIIKLNSKMKEVACERLKENEKNLLKEINLLKLEGG